MFVWVGGSSFVITSEHVGCLACAEVYKAAAGFFNLRLMQPENLRVDELLSFLCMGAGWSLSRRKAIIQTLSAGSCEPRCQCQVHGEQFIRLSFRYLYLNHL